MPHRLFALAEQDLDDIWSYLDEDASPATVAPAFQTGDYSVA